MPHGVSQGSGFATAYIPCNQGYGAYPEGVIEAFFDRNDFRGFKDFVNLQIRAKGFSFKAEESSITHIHY